MPGGQETILFEPASIYQLRLPIEPAPSPLESNSSLDVVGTLEELLRPDLTAERRASTRQLPSETACQVLHDLKKKDERRAEVVAYYYRDLEAGLKEMLRVTAAGRAAVIVVGSSTICQVGIKVPAVTAELAEAVGFRLVGLARREIVRDARMMPVSHKSDRNGIEARMHEEGAVGLVKPEKGELDANPRGDNGARSTIVG